MGTRAEAEYLTIRSRQSESSELALLRTSRPAQKSTDATSAPTTATAARGKQLRRQLAWTNWYAKEAATRTPINSHRRTSAHTGHAGNVTPDAAPPRCNDSATMRTASRGSGSFLGVRTQRNGVATTCSLNLTRGFRHGREPEFIGRHLYTAHSAQLTGARWSSRACGTTGVAWSLAGMTMAMSSSGTRYTMSPWARPAFAR